MASTPTYLAEAVRAEPVAQSVEPRVFSEKQLQHGPLPSLPPNTAKPHRVQSRAELTTVPNPTRRRSASVGPDRARTHARSKARTHAARHARTHAARHTRMHAARHARTHAARRGGCAHTSRRTGRGVRAHTRVHECEHCRASDGLRRTTHTMQRGSYTHHAAWQLHAPCSVAPCY